MACRLIAASVDHPYGLSVLTFLLTKSKKIKCCGEESGLDGSLNVSLYGVKAFIYTSCVGCKCSQIHICQPLIIRSSDASDCFPKRDCPHTTSTHTHTLTHTVNKLNTALSLKFNASFEIVRGVSWDSCKCLVQKWKCINYHRKRDNLT